MSRQAWGKTGRVTLGLMDSHFGDRVRNVLVDGKAIGRVLYPRKRSPFRAFGGQSNLPETYREDLPSLDAAVMYILRRAAPDVWREERGPVWLVRLSYDDMSREWLAINPRRSRCVAAETCADALGEADRLARQEGEGQ